MTLFRKDGTLNPSSYWTAVALLLFRSVSRNSPNNVALGQAFKFFYNRGLLLPKPRKIAVSDQTARRLIIGVSPVDTSDVLASSILQSPSLTQNFTRSVRLHWQRVSEDGNENGSRTSRLTFRCQTCAWGGWEPLAVQEQRCIYYAIGGTETDL